MGYLWCMIERQIAGKISEMVGKFPVLVITGPRQSGKTTLIKSMFSDYTYVSLEDLDVREFAAQDPRSFLNQYSGKLIIDEAQNVPELFSYIQGRVDDNQVMGQFILSGSQNFSLMERISQSLAGRAYIIHLLPLSYNERRSKLSQSLHDAVYSGGYPAIYDRQIHPSDYFPSYVDTYLERDVRTLLNVSNLGRFTSFLRLCAGRTGQIFNASQLSIEVGVDYKTIQNWITVLEASFILYRLQPWHRNFNKRIIKSPKLYFYDTGLLCYLLGISDAEQYQQHFARGAIFENYVITELRKEAWNSGQKPNFFFWRDKTGHEIDLIIDRGSRIKAIEIKAGETFTDRFNKGLSYFKRIVSDVKMESEIIYAGDADQHRADFTLRSWRNVGELID